MESKLISLKTQQAPRGCPMSKMDPTSNQIISFLRQKLTARYGDGEPKRIFHKKTIGLVKAELRIKEGLDNYLKRGLFGKEKSYKAWIRFTNGSPDHEPDIKKAARGMAIKILDVEGFEFLDTDPAGKTQDIILFNHPTFTPGLPQLQMAGVKVVAGNWIEFIGGALTILFRQFKAGLEFIRFARIRTPNVLEEIYYSATPYSFGEGNAIKWQAFPRKTITSVLPKNPLENYLRDRLKKDLSKPKEEISFDLRVQFSRNLETEPIEDSTVEWKTEFIHVGTIIIPAQDIDAKELSSKSSELSFCPSHSIIEHAPLGKVNMIRRNVYKTLAGDRARFNKTDSTRLQSLENPLISATTNGVVGHDHN